MELRWVRSTPDERPMKVYLEQKWISETASRATDERETEWREVLGADELHQYIADQIESATGARP